MGRALVAASPRFVGPFGRGFDGVADDGTLFSHVLLAVPDGAIAAAVACVPTDIVVGHCAGALGLDVLGDRPAFGIHPLMTVTAGGATFAGAGAAVAGSTPATLAFARGLADDLGMVAFTIADHDRAAYHAAAAIASNFLTSLEDAAEQLLATTGAGREILVPLVRASMENWAALGGRAALTGPISRGDEATVARQRATVAERTPHLLAMFDELCAVTRALAARPAS
jgi:predicted short-subunit dehydrogenase-like oxidoreductase (DUF2520 family)